MEWLYTWAPVLGCGLMMLVCMRMMTGAGSKHGGRDTSTGQDAEETKALRSRLAELERRLEVEGDSRSRERSQR